MRASRIEKLHCAIIPDDLNGILPSAGLSREIDDFDGTPRPLISAKDLRSG